MKNKTLIENIEEIMKLIMSDMVPEVAGDLQIGFQEADDIVRATDFYKVLSSESVLRDDYVSDSLLLILRKELVRSGIYPIRNGDAEVEDFVDFVKAMKHEIVYNCAVYDKLELNLSQVSLLIEGIENSIIDANTARSMKDLSDAFYKSVSYLKPAHIGNNEIDKMNAFNEIWWKLNVNIQTLLAYCKNHDKSPVDLKAEEIDDFLPVDM